MARMDQAIPYSSVGLTFGAGVGIVVGALTGWSIALAICLGAGVGLVVGAAIAANQDASTR